MTPKPLIFSDCPWAGYVFVPETGLHVRLVAKCGHACLQGVCCACGSEREWCQVCAIREGRQ